MPLFLWLATFLGTIFTSLVTAFAGYMTKRLAIVLAVIAAIAALTTGFFIAIFALASGIATVAPPFVIVAWSLFVPTNLPVLVSAALTARVLRWVYDWNVKIIQYRLF
jgi:hypothetical protein